MKTQNKTVSGSSHRSYSSQSYQYTTLNDAKVNEDTVHFYGVILDASFPHKSYNSDRYVCSIKIADPSCEIDGNG